jgi:hypothetical protein
MTFDEELFNDHLFLQLEKNRQYELIAKHCADIEKQIRTASSRSDAERISTSACFQFENECPSNLLRNALTRRVKELIAKYWSKEQ